MRNIAPLMILSDSDRFAIGVHAKDRTLGRKDTSFNENATRKQAIAKNGNGIAGEVCYARFFGVPWYQNPTRGRGDHARRGDLELADGSWLEVKTVRGANGYLRVDPTTGDRWDLIALAVRQDLAHSNLPAYRLCGTLTRARWMELRERDPKRRDHWIVSRGKMTPLDAFIYSKTPGSLTEILQRKERGLRCPHCTGLWPCSTASCLKAVEIRLDVLGSLFKGASRILLER